MFFKVCAAALCIAAVLAEPPVNNGYLPPVTARPGYNYPTPVQPLTTPSQPQYRPSTGPTYGPPPTARPPPPPPQRPAYGPPPPTPQRPAYGPPPPPPKRPAYGPPPPPQRPTYGPPVTTRPPPSYGPPTAVAGYSPDAPLYPSLGSSSNALPVGQAIQNDLPGVVQAPQAGGGHDHGDHHHHEPGMPFDFNYAVKDDYYGTDYKHNAVSDGDVVRGEYQVLLPDGRLQIVTYTADWKNGFNADVKYQGEPKYPAASPAPSGQSGNYQQPGGYPAPASGPY